MKTIAQKWRNSISIKIPRELANKYGISNGTVIILKETEKGIYIERDQSEPTLDEMLAQITDENRHEEIDWGKPTGKEIW